MSWLCKLACGIGTLLRNIFYLKGIEFWNTTNLLTWRDYSMKWKFFKWIVFLNDLEIIWTFESCRIFVVQKNVSPTEKPSVITLGSNYSFFRIS